MNGSDQANSVPALRELSADEILEINAVPLNYPYNFAEPPYPTIHWKLWELIQHGRFPFALTDNCDKWKISQFSMENFSSLIDVSRVGEAGFISALTVAKLIAYSLQIAESTSEMLVNEHQQFTGEKLLERITEFSQSSMMDPYPELSPWRQFFIAVKHPVVKRGVNNALFNRWGSRDYPLHGEGSRPEDRVGFPKFFEDPSVSPE